ncbi:MULTISPECIES: SLATT domain-containing protein [unclassified Caballeronia]|uniref:SLATT domain-containing protein n=1 Tax=unclassified Caballeronia TaxID=2646786 RepID=UPI002856686B|nr:MULTISPECIES: SLATT domain-containing protein [unclassified Caballeronia]MDR5816076.1 SLATT domain-containing protein [Caballeronia sp. LZ033]MDR5822739.1 SLATT domain-containing protein [Caballeronia sp. LZ043]MDR5880792.1 SLATT domain-containing protein [Caballeronia sp. LZ032]
MTEPLHQTCEPPQDARALVLNWIRRARESQIRHYTMADRLTASGRKLGLAVIGITTATGTSAFLSLVATAISPQLRIVIGLTSIGAAVLASLQTFLRYSERAELHRRAGAQYGAVRRRLEAIHAADPYLHDMRDIEGVRDELDQIAQNAPHLPRGIVARG